LVRNRLAYSLIACLASVPALANPILNESDYLSDVLQHLDRAKMALESGQTSLALAHTRIVLHDQGLNIYFDLSNVAESQKEDCLKAASESVRYWNSVLGEGSLRTVQNESDAQVRIDFREEVVLQNVQVGGYCSQSRAVTSSPEGEAIDEYRATILARTKWPGGRNLSGDYLRNIVTHEMGHLYGLSDCAEPGHLMSPLNPTKTKFDLHPEELEALKQLRLTAFETQRSIQAKSKGN